MGDERDRRLGSVRVQLIARDDVAVGIDLVVNAKLVERRSDESCRALLEEGYGWPCAKLPQNLHGAILRIVHRLMRWQAELSPTGYRSCAPIALTPANLTFTPAYMRRPCIYAPALHICAGPAYMRRRRGTNPPESALRLGYDEIPA